MQNIIIEINFTFLYFVALSFYLNPRPVREGCRPQSDTETPLATITSVVPCSCQSTVASYSYFINLNKLVLR
jgi:hypothetical protein